MTEEWITIKNATQNNLKAVTVKIPKKQLTVVTGLSGSGKSFLVFDTLAAESRRELNETFPSFLQHYLPKYGRPEVQQISNLPVAIVIDQKKLSENARSTVGTYTDIYTFLRLLFSRIGKPFIGYSDHFSFNHPAGKCPTCDGLGTITTMNIHQLNLTVSECWKFFKDEAFADQLQALVDVGLGYLRLNQSLTTLSGGELQRLKLADQIHRTGSIYLLDEPTDGLHLEDIKQLLKLFDRMVDQGNSLILLEHHTAVMKQADW